MKILTFSSLYPNAVDQSHGIFVERRLLKLIEKTDVAAEVVAPVPWFPFRSRLFGKYGQFAAVPRMERRHGIDVYHPRFPIIPKVGMSLAPRGMIRGCEHTVSNLVIKTRDIALVDAHYFYPDGVAAAALSERLGIPFIVTARGSDINLIATMARPGSMILEAASKARAVIAVSHALGRKMQDLGIPDEKIHILRNGVDTEYFQPGERQLARKVLDIESPTFLSVGALKEAKGHDIAIETLLHLPGAKLFVIGAGEYESALKSLVARRGLQDRVTFTGVLSAATLRTYYQAADALLLMSRREGMPNVVLESLACGTPVIAADVGGIGEVLDSPALGNLLSDRKPQSVAEAWSKLSQQGIDREAIRSIAVSFSWDDTIEKLHDLMRSSICASAH